MCASYGLDPRFTDSSDILAGDEAMLEALRSWAAGNDDATLRPTGKVMRNLNPIITAPAGARTLERGWWGFLVNGEPARFPSINSRSERLGTGSGPLPPRALVPATRWFEMQKPQRTWHQFTTGELFSMAAVTRPGRTADGEEHTCYSIVMQDAPDRLAGIHGRSPVLVPHDFAEEWLTSGAPAAELIDEALSLSAGVLARVTAAELSGRP